MGQFFSKNIRQERFIRTDALRLFCLSPILLAVSFVPASSASLPATPVQQTTSPATGNNPRTLSPGEIVNLDMEGGEKHAFLLTLAPQQYVQVVVEQKGIDVVVRLLAPNGEVILRVDSPNNERGPEAVSTIARIAGSYLVEVEAEKTQPPGAFELHVNGPREATSADHQRVTAEHLFMEGQTLRSQRTEASFTEAIKYYKRALDIWRELGDSRQQGYTLCNIGRTYKELQNLSAAVDYLSQARSALVAAQDVAGQAFVVNEIAAAHRDLGDPLRAIASYNEALELWRSIGDQWGQAHIYNNLGDAYSRISEQPKSIENLEMALPLWRAVGDRGKELNTLNNIAKANLDQGNLTVAFEQFQSLLGACNSAAERCYLEPFVRNSLGTIYDIWGVPREALSQYEAALELFRTTRNGAGQVIGNPAREAIVHDNIGMLYAGLNDADTALSQFQDALAIRVKLHDRGGESITRSNIGYAQSLLGNQPEALNQLQRALTLSQTAHNRSFEAYTLVRIGVVYLAQRDLGRALENFTQALEIQEQIKDVRGQAITLDKIGEIHGLSNRPLKAIESYDQALQRWTSVGDLQGEALSLYGSARIERDQNRLDQARDQIKRALEKVESLRSKLTSHELRMTYFAARQAYYELAIDIFMRRYDVAHSTTDLETALAISERARARGLLDFLIEARVRIDTGSTPALATRLSRLESEIGVLYQKIPELRNQKRTNEAAAAEERLASLIREQDDLEAKMRAADPAYAHLKQPDLLGTQEIQALLDDDTLLLEYSLGEKRSYLWAVTRKEVIARSLPARTEIEAAAEAYRSSLTAYEPPRPGETNLQYIARRRDAAANYRQRASTLSSLVIGPVSQNLGNKRLIIVADGALQYVPFAALPAPGSPPENARSKSLAIDPLLLNHEIVYQFSASALALLRDQLHVEPPMSVAVIADPVFDLRDERVRGVSSPRLNAPQTQTEELRRSLRDAGDSGAGELKLERLRYSGEEADGIIAAAVPGSWMKAVGFKASRATALSPALKQFKVVHFATHGILNAKHPELSGIVFSLFDERGQPENGFLNLTDIYHLNLPVDLVVLSACQTAIGKQVRGEGLIGLTRGFMHAGASRVMASLWKVNDAATAELMKRIYVNLLEKNLPAAAALRSAQLEMRAADEQWQAPYYWAGFVLQGEWK